MKPQIYAGTPDLRSLNAEVAVVMDTIDGKTVKSGDAMLRLAIRARRILSRSVPGAVATGLHRDCQSTD